MIIRPAHLEDAAGIAHVHVATWLCTYRGIIPDEYLDAIQFEKRHARWIGILKIPAPAQFTHVAEDEENGTIAGFVGGGPTRHPELPYRGELYAISILQEYQQRSLGRRLVRTLATDLLHAVLPEMLLWVFEQNNTARRFYEKLGGRYVKTNTLDIRGVAVNECAYGWTDPRTLIEDKQT